jgi:hypothetical protein
MLRDIRRVLGHFKNSSVLERLNVLRQAGLT